MKISPLRRGLAEYLDDEQLHRLKKKLSVELKLLKFLSVYRVSDSNLMAFAREDDDYIYISNSANYYAKKHARTLYNEELIDVYLAKFNNDTGRGENLYVINENGLRLLGIDDDFEIGLNDIQKYLQKSQYSICRQEELLMQKYRVLNVFYNDFYFHIKYGDSEDIYNEYVFADEYKFIANFNKFMINHSNYNDTYTILIEDVVRTKELKAMIKEKINPIILNDRFRIIEKRNDRNQKTLRPGLEIMGG